MFRIRRVYDAILPINNEVIRQVQQILKAQFNGIPEEDIIKLPENLNNPLKYKFRSMLFVADDIKGHIKGFALLLYAPDLRFCYLDFISAAVSATGRGVGGALYSQVREFSRQIAQEGLYFECLPDDPGLCRDKNILKQNAIRLKFYERFGARPIINTAYETPLTPDSDCPPYLVYDDLDTGKLPGKKSLKNIMRAILERKYGDVCPEKYVKLVVDSVKDDPVKLREPKYIKKRSAENDSMKKQFPSLEISLVVNDRHDIHHVHDRGYVEAPVRVNSILKEIERTGLFRKIRPRNYPMKYITAVHDSGFVRYLEKVCRNVPAKKSIYPYVFPIRNAARPPVELPVRAGYYCIDTFTPLNQDAFHAAKRSVDCALTAADELLQGAPIAYALVRPPGHHAEKKAFGGFCYFNSAAVAAQYLCWFGKIAILDIDYHHGNGAQNIFYERSDVLTISIHGHPRFAYPYFSGFSDETGRGEGTGYNINYPLPEQVTGEVYRKVLNKAIKSIEKFKPRFLLVTLGLDTAKGDPTGTWDLTARDLEMNGRLIGLTGLPLLIVQEGGYRVRKLGINARSFFTGLAKGFMESH
ncbi:MAG: histone deacetylase family protein [Calditrichaceae bacterium]|nr:histone deacetylase family protein [Calditrichaceae bacterium]MBN2708994.1 histone deacetylase family protein [Calditrichaceae bacterium]RQV93335.1 MAG: histone deacetylase family protein [Calditrichota bacterium]